MFLYGFRLFLLLWLLSGCAVKVASPQERETRVHQLTKILLAQSSKISRVEAEDVAKRSVFFAEDLSRQYKLVSPPLWHNTLVNVGLKKRGLCYEWANDMWTYLHRKVYKSLKIYYIGANIGTYFEHNALSISAKGEDLNHSVIIDAWRDSGRLFFIELKKDKKYEWRERLDI